MQLPWHLNFCNCRAMSTGCLTFTSHHYKLTEFCEKPNHLAGYWGCIQMAMSSGGGKRVVITQFCKKNPPWWCPAGLQPLPSAATALLSLLLAMILTTSIPQGSREHYTIIPYKLRPFSDWLLHKIWPRAADGQPRGVPVPTGQLHGRHIRYSPKGNHSCQSG